MKMANHKHEVQFAWTTHGHMEAYSTGIPFFLKTLKAVSAFEKTKTDEYAFWVEIIFLK